jgi:hypothetical protein
MRTATDAVLSAQRYFAVALGADWECRLWTDEGSFSPPIARIAEAGPVLHARHGRGVVEMVLPLQLHCYTAPGPSAAASLERARAVEELLTQIIETGSGDGRPRRIPLYDFPGETRNYYDYLRVIDFSVTRTMDAQDATLIVVIADLRVGWSRVTVLDPDQVTVGELRLRDQPA